MNLIETDELVKAVSTGFHALQAEYQKLHGQHRALERRLATALEQYNELAKRCSESGNIATPPTSLSPNVHPDDVSSSDEKCVVEILDEGSDEVSQQVAGQIRDASEALNLLIRPAKIREDNGVKIWSGRSADERRSSGRRMPVVSESPLEQDFTIEGVPSKLGCPFAGMANKKLSSHAASVLSRYNHGSNTGAPSSAPVSADSRIDGRESFAKRRDHRPSIPDPIKADLRGQSDHDRESPHSERVPNPERALKDHLEKQEEAEPGVCPIRFLDQHSPEEVATYFENHKHELPRSHEVCVKRYQSNEQQIQELDAKYGNLVTMIQGLGAKHKEYLPAEPDDEEIEQMEGTSESAEKVRKWADNVSARAIDGREEVAIEDEDQRQSHFERPLRDIRVGESPSRPWGISVPVKYLERQNTQASSLPAAVDGKVHEATQTKPDNHPKTEQRGKCPFDFGQQKSKPGPDVDAERVQGKTPVIDMNAKSTPTARPAFVSGDSNDKVGRMVFTGPVFIGYSAEDAAKILQNTGLGGR